MKVKKRCLLSLMLLFTMLMTVIVFGSRVAFAGNLPYANSNLENYLIKSSSLFATDDGYTRVFYVKDPGVIYVESYDNSFRLTGRRKLQKELESYGGFYRGQDACYLIFGQSNTDEDDSREIVRVVKYDNNWNRVGAASIAGRSEFGMQVRYPFEYGNVSAAECGGMLYIVTGHEGYVDESVGTGHQGMLMFAVNESSMTGQIVDADLWHSFSQHIVVKDKDHIYVLEESEGSRQTQITLKTSTDLVGKTIPVLPYGGSRDSVWAIPTYASADAIAYSGDSVLAVGTSIDQSRYSDENYNKTYNIYVTVTPMGSFSEEATTVRWLTDYSSGESFDNVKMTKINDNKFIVSWEMGGTVTSQAADGDLDSMSDHVLHYICINGHGEKIGTEHTAAAALSDCEPIVKDGKVINYASDNASVAFYTIDPDKEGGTVSKTVYYSAGPDARWRFSGGTLSISGRGKISDSLTSDGLGRIRNSVKKVIIGEGITEIGKRSFSGLPSLQVVRIARSVVKIGDEAFYGANMNLGDVYIPETVQTIGSGVFDTGWFWQSSGDPVRVGTIVCMKDSPAYRFAMENSMQYTVAAVTLKDKTSKFTGKAIAIGKAQAAGTAGRISYTYYTDSDCTVKTTKEENGCGKEGGAPSKAGTYYVLATAAADRTFPPILSNKAKLTIKADEASPSSRLKKNAMVKDSAGNSYRVLTVTKTGGKVTGGTVALKAPSSKKIVTLSVGSTIKVYGVTLKVTAIGAEAFKDCSSLVRVTIGSNVKMIGKKAFYSCGKLKSIVIRSTGLTSASVGADAFRGTHEKAVVKAPKAVLSRCKKVLCARGLSSKAVFKELPQ